VRRIGVGAASGLGVKAPRRSRALLSDWPLERPRDLVELLVNKVMSEKETAEVRTCVARNRPYGAEQWQTDVAKRLGLSHTLRNEGRPKATRSLPTGNKLRPSFGSPSFGWFGSILPTDSFPTFKRRSLPNASENDRIVAYFQLGNFP